MFMKKLISAMMALTLVLTCFAGCGKKVRDTSTLAMYTENYSVTKSMLTYCFNSQYLSFVTANRENLEAYGLDTTQPLDKQECPLNNANWYDYFMDVAKSRLEQCLIVAEKATADGKKLSEAEEKAIEAELEVLKSEAKKKKLNLADYIEKTYGDGVTSDDLISVTRMEKLVNKYYDKFEKKLDTSEKAVTKYFEGHKRLYSTVDYLSFYITPLGDSMQESSAAQRAAMTLSESKTPEEFLEFVGDYITDYYTNYYGVKLSKKEIKEKVNETKDNCAIKGAGYDPTSAASRWAFDNNRIVNEGTYIEDSENGGYAVYFLTSLPTREEYNSVNIRQIVFDIADFGSEDEALQAAQKAILNLELNEYSPAYFKKLSEEYSADAFSKANGGLYENVTKGNLVNAEELEEWIFDASRKNGDITLLQTDEYGYHVVYIEKIGEPVWLLRSREGMVNARFSEYISDMGDDYVVYMNDNVIYSVSEAEIETAE